MCLTIFPYRSQVTFSGWRVPLSRWNHPVNSKRSKTTVPTKKMKVEILCPQRRSLSCCVQTTAASKGIAQMVLVFVMKDMSLPTALWDSMKFPNCSGNVSFYVVITYLWNNYKNRLLLLFHSRWRTLPKRENRQRNILSKMQWKFGKLDKWTEDTCKIYNPKSNV